MALALVLLAHVVDLSTHDEWFIRTYAPDQAHGDLASLRRVVGDDRLAVDLSHLASQRQFDDVGFFDSIILARPYRALMELAGAPATTNVQAISGSQLPLRALVATATKMVIPPGPDGRDAGSTGREVSSPLPRASFVPLSRTRFVNPQELHERLRDPSYDLRTGMMLVGPPEPGGAPSGADGESAISVAYERPSSDLAVISMGVGERGFLRFIESYDPGWSATVDGRAAEVLPADDFAIAVGVERGHHRVELRYRTPGAATGLAISMVSLVLLAALLARSRYQERIILPPRGRG
jgi:hypothetical protein